MHIWVDADACPKSIKEILYRVVQRTHIPMTLVANAFLQTPASTLIKKVQVQSGFDVADNYIVQNLQKGDLIITADIILADLVIHHGGIALNPRGELYSHENIKQRLAMRNFNESLRDNGIQTRGPDKLTARDNQTFANQLDRLLAKTIKEIKNTDFLKS